MKKRTKFLSLTVAVLMIFSLLPFSAFATGRNAGAIEKLTLEIDGYYIGNTLNDVVFSDDSEFTDDSCYSISEISEAQKGGVAHVVGMDDGLTEDIDYIRVTIPFVPYDSETDVSALNDEQNITIEGAIILSYEFIVDDSDPSSVRYYIDVKLGAPKKDTVDSFSMELRGYVENSENLDPLEDSEYLSAILYNLYDDVDGECAELGTEDLSIQANKKYWVQIKITPESAYENYFTVDNMSTENVSLMVNENKYFPREVIYNESEDAAYALFALDVAAPVIDITSIELSIQQTPKTGASLFTPTVASLNGDAELAKYLEITSSSWGCSSTYSTDYDDYSDYTSKYFEGNYAYSLRMNVLPSEYIKIAETCVVTVVDNAGVEGRVDVETGYLGLFFEVLPEGHSITVTSATAPAKAEEGAIVSVSANKAAFGKIFYKWESVSGDVEFEDPYSVRTTFVMPNGNVEIKATYISTPRISEIDVYFPELKAGEKLPVPEIVSVNSDVALKSLVTILNGAADWYWSADYSSDYFFSIEPYNSETLEEGIAYYEFIYLEAVQGISFADSCTVNAVDKNGSILSSETYTEAEDEINTDGIEFSLSFFELDAITVESIELSLPDNFIPKAGGEVFNMSDTSYVEKVNGSELLSSIVSELEIMWYCDREYDERGNYNFPYERNTFESGFSYEANIFVRLTNVEFDIFSENAVITVKTPSGEMQLKKLFSAANWATFSAVFNVEKTDGALESVGGLGFTLSGYEKGTAIDDMTLSTDNANVEVVSFELLDSENNAITSGNIAAKTQYFAKVTLTAKEGYTFYGSNVESYNDKLNGLEYSYRELTFDAVSNSETLDLWFDLPVLGDGSNELDAISIEFTGYEVGNKWSDIAITSKTEGTSVNCDISDYAHDFWFSDEKMYNIMDPEETIIASHKGYYLTLYIDLSNNHDVSKLTAEAVTFNGLPSWSIILGTDVNESTGEAYNDYIAALFKLPELHDYNSEWKFDEKNHWIECACASRFFYCKILKSHKKS